jgi:hypothetical protein
MNCSAEYQYALTGTIQINDVDDDVFRLYYGYKTELKIIHMKPSYLRVHSQFEYYLDDIKDFHILKSELYGNESRNQLIIDTVMKHIL